MNKKHVILIGILIILGIVFIATYTPEEEKKEISSVFKIINTGRGEDYGYVVYESSGKGKMEIISAKVPFSKRIFILNQKGVGMNSYYLFEKKLKELERLGFEVKVVGPETIPNDGLLIIPTGGMPFYILENISERLKRQTIIYIGKRDLYLKNGVKKKEWTTKEISENPRICIIDKTLDEFMDEGGDIEEMIIKNKWAEVDQKDIELSGELKNKTEIFDIGESANFRVIYSNKNETKIYDFGPYPKYPVSFEVKGSGYPWEDIEVSFEIKRSNGTVNIKIEKDGKKIQEEELIKVTEKNIFLKRYRLEDPGNYILVVYDRSGTLGKKIIHIKKVEIKFLKSVGNMYLFNVTEDDKAIKDTEVFVTLGNSSEGMKIAVSDGLLSVPAKLKKGKNVFKISAFGKIFEVEVVEEKEDLIDVYTKYGIPGIIIAIAIYIIAKLTRKPVYRIRYEKFSLKPRKEMKIKKEEMLRLMEKIRKKFNIKGPISSKEFYLGIKKFLTDGMEVAEGNIDRILKKLVEKGVLIEYKGYYTEKTANMTKEKLAKLVLMRRIKEKLIEKGIEFKEKEKKFECKDFEIGLPEAKFKKMAYVVFEDNIELEKYLNKRSNQERAKIELKIGNGILKLISLEELDEIL